VQNEEFSEFSYGFVLTAELIKRFDKRMSAAPVFPSLREEGKTGGGYDVKLPGVPMFLQFKLSDRMKRKSAQELQTTPSPLKIEFYRMHLRPRKKSKQHSLLLELESAGNLVFYAAPGFFEAKELDLAYSNQQVINRSVFIRPTSIGPLKDDLSHHVSFQNAASKKGYFFSDSENPPAVEITRGADLHEAVRPILETAGINSLSTKRFANIESSMAVAIKEAYADTEFLPHRAVFTEPNVSNVIQRVAYLSQVFFDSTLFIVQRKKQIA